MDLHGTGERVWKNHKEVRRNPLCLPGLDLLQEENAFLIKEERKNVSEWESWF